MPVEQVVAQDQSNRVFSDELLADKKGIGETSWFVLHCIFKMHTDSLPRAEQLLEDRNVSRRRNDQHFTDACEHQYRKGIVDHGLVIYWKNLLRHCKSDGIQPGSGTPGKNDSLHDSS